MNHIKIEAFIEGWPYLRVRFILQQQHILELSEVVFIDQGMASIRVSLYEGYYILLSFTSRYVFKRLKFLGNKTLSWALTMLFVGVWHGVWPGYYINFSLEMIMVMAERKVRDPPNAHLPHHHHSFLSLSLLLLLLLLPTLPTVNRVSEEAVWLFVV